jgi:hypothetical protein
MRRPVRRSTVRRRGSERPTSMQQLEQRQDFRVLPRRGERSLA